MLKSLTGPLLSVIFPRVCRVCVGHVEGLDDGPACGDCWKSTKFFTGNEMLCNKCGAFFSDEPAAVPVYCRKCDDHSYDSATALGVYEKALSAAILDLKINPLISTRIKTIVKDTSSKFSGIDIVIPVPLSKQRSIERGYNQADIIARLVAENIVCPVDTGSLVRSSHTPIHRMGMDQRARELTVEKAFKVVRPKLVDGKNVLLVDDVFTSGATASACAKVLKKSGATSVKVFTLARAVLN